MTLQLEQTPKKDKDSKIYLVIVGSDGRKFNKEQEKTAKEVIKETMLFAQRNKKLIPPVDINAKGRQQRAKILQQIIKIPVTVDITVVSGHCPVGEERWYCVDCEKWLDTSKGETFLHSQGHRMVKVHKNGGIDTWAEIIAKKVGIPTKIIKPEVHQWLDKQPKQATIPVSVSQKGYRSRNIDMAKIGTIGYDIEVAGNCRHCGGKGRKELYEFPKTKSGISGIYDCKYCKGTGAYSGGTFTINEMKKLGKEVHKIVIE